MTTGKVSTNCNYVQPVLAEAILIVLMSLTATTALDQMFSQLRIPAEPAFLWSQLTGSLDRTFLLLCQLAVFFFTLLRFYWGSLRFHQARQGYEKIRVILFDIVGNTIIFIGLYVCALAVRTTTNFYIFMVALHVVDALWFVAAWLSGAMEESLQVLIKRFIVYDICTATLFGFFYWTFYPNLGAPYYFQWFCLVILLIVGFADFRQNRKVYLEGVSDAA